MLIQNIIFQKLNLHIINLVKLFNHYWTMSNNLLANYPTHLLVF